MQNQHIRELISAQKTPHKHNNKDLSCQWQLVWHTSKYKVNKLHQRYFLWRCTSGGVCVSCIYLLARRELLYVAQIIVVWHLLSAN